MIVKRTAIIGAMVLAGLSAAHAQKKYGPGVTDTEIKLGQSLPYSGPVSAFAVAGRVMTGYLQMLNESGGINGRKVTLISLDNAYSPSKALEQTRRLVEDDGVLAETGTVGTVPNAAIQKYMNQNKVPQLFVGAGGRRFNDPKNFPWTVPFYPQLEMEGKIVADYILKSKPEAKVAVLYQNDDTGKDFYAGVKAGLEGKTAKVVADASYELTSPTIDSQIAQLKASGADFVIYAATPKFVVQALRKTWELGWRPTQFLNSGSNSVDGVMKQAGFDAVQGVLTAQHLKDVSQVDDPEVKEYIAFMKKWVPNDPVDNATAVSAYTFAQGIAKALADCGDDLTRENLLKQAVSYKNARFKMILPGVVLNNSADNYSPYSSMRMSRFEGTGWRVIDDTKM